MNKCNMECFVSYDVDSVWAVSSTLEAFDICPGIHHVHANLFSTTTKADFSRKSSWDISYNAITLISRSEFPVKLLLHNISGPQFRDSVLLPSLRDLPHCKRTSYYNGCWLWQQTPEEHLRMTNDKRIHLDSCDLQLVEQNIARHLVEEFPEASVKYGLFINGLHADPGRLIMSLEVFLDRRYLEFVAIHQAVEFTVPGGSTLRLRHGVNLRGCTKYRYLSSPLFVGFSCKGRSGLPNMCDNIRERIGYIQAYYPLQSHASSYDASTRNSPVTLAAIFGFGNDNSLLKKLSSQASDILAKAHAGLQGFAAGACPIRFEIVPEWRNEEPQYELDGVLELNAIKTLVRNIVETDVLEVVTAQEIQTVARPIISTCDELQQAHDANVMPHNISHLSRICGLESILKVSITGTTRYINYQTMKATLGGRTFVQSVGQSGELVIPDSGTSDPSTLLDDLMKSEKLCYWDVIALAVALLARREAAQQESSARQVAETIIEGVKMICGLPALTEDAARNAGATVSGHISYSEVIESLIYMKLSHPLRTYLAALLQKTEIDQREINAELFAILQRGNIFPSWRPHYQHDSRTRFYRLYLTPPEQQFAKALHFLEQELGVAIGRLVRMTRAHRAVSLCLNVASHLAGMEDTLLTKWSAWLLLLLMAEWTDRRGFKYPYFRYTKWHDNLGMEGFGEPLIVAGILQPLPPDDNRDEKYTILGRFELVEGYVRRLQEWHQTFFPPDLQQQELEPRVPDDTEEDEELEEEGNEEEEENSVPLVPAVRCRRRGIRALLDV